MAFQVHYFGHEGHRRYHDVGSVGDDDGVYPSLSGWGVFSIIFSLFRSIFSFHSQSEQ